MKSKFTCSEKEAPEVTCTTLKAMTFLSFAIPAANQLVNMLIFDI